MVNRAGQIRVSNSLTCTERLVNQVGEVRKVGSEAATHSQTELWDTKMSSGATGSGPGASDGEGALSRAVRQVPPAGVPAAGSECAVGRTGILAQSGKSLGVKGGLREVAKQVALLPAPRVALRACRGGWGGGGTEARGTTGVPREPVGSGPAIGWAVGLGRQERNGVGQVPKGLWEEDAGCPNAKRPVTPQRSGPPVPDAPQPRPQLGDRAARRPGRSPGAPRRCPAAQVPPDAGRMGKPEKKSP